MKWLVVLFSLFMHTQVSAVGLCKPTADGEGAISMCIGGWNGATKAVAYSLALQSMLEKLLVVITYDSYVNNSYVYGAMCYINTGDYENNPPIPSTGCMGHMPLKSAINASLTTAFHRTIKTSRKLEAKLLAIATSQVTYYGGVHNSPERQDELHACNTRHIHKRVASLWADFADNFQRDYDAYQDKYRKKIFKHYFQAIKRLYGIYANRMKKLMKKVKREYDCTD